MNIEEVQALAKALAPAIKEMKQEILDELERRFRPAPQRDQVVEDEDLGSHR